MKDSFIFYRVYYEAMAGLSAEEKGHCLDALANYILNDEEKYGLEPSARLFFTLIKPQLKKECKKTPKEKFTKPTIDEIQTYCQERKNNVSAEQFYNFYESKGWKVGNQPMKDWQAAVRTWEKKEKQSAPLDWL